MNSPGAEAISFPLTSQIAYQFAMHKTTNHYFCYIYDHGNVTRVISMQEQISKSQFKAKALELFRKVELSGDSIIVTDHGKPTIEVRKFHRKERDPLDVLKGSVTEYAEPTEPVGESDWEILA